MKKYAVEDNCWAKLETSIDATATKIRIKETHNLPQSWEWIATLVKKQGDEIIKMEKVLVVKRELNLLTVQRGFQSTAQAWEENDVINLYITAEIIREIQRGFDKKADLIDGKVPKSQIPEVSLDESNLVHKSWDEVIDWGKTLSGWLALQNSKLYLRSHWDDNHYIMFDPWAWNWSNWVKIHEIGGFTFSTSHWDKIKFTEQGNINFMNSEVELTIKDLTLSKHNPRETQTISQYAKATNWTPWGIHFVDYVAATPNWLTNWGKELRGYLHIGDGVRTFDKFQVRGYEWFDWTEASLPNARKYIKLDAPKILLWDEDILGEWKSWTPSSAYNVNEVVNHSCKYKLIGKTLMICWNVMLKSWGTQEFAITLPHRVLDSSWGVELRWPWSFQFTRWYCQCVWGSLWFHSWDSNIPVNQNMVLRFSAILQTI